MIGGLGIIRGQGSGGSQTKVAPFWTDRYPSEIGDEMSAIENDAWVEAVARALAESWGADPDLFVLGRPAWRSHKAEARAAIRAVVPLLIERCAEVADQFQDPGRKDAYDEGSDDTAKSISAAIRALIQKEASDA